MHDRNSKMLLHKTYFWTNTIKDWKKLLKPDKYKQLIVDTLGELVARELIKVYGFVIMPNHLHIIWKLLGKNGKEMPHASFNKATSHLIIKDLKVNHVDVLPFFKVDEKERQFRVWQRDPLAVQMDSREKIAQKLDYLHLNPLPLPWSVAHRPKTSSYGNFLLKSFYARSQFEDASS